jgi:hypothetical protein
MKPDTYEAQLAREQLYCLLNRCPLEGNSDDCQFCRWREEPLDLRHHWLLELDDEECIELARKHRDCLESQIHAVHTVHV